MIDNGFVNYRLKYCYIDKTNWISAQNLFPAYTNAFKKYIKRKPGVKGSTIDLFGVTYKEEIPGKIFAHFMGVILDRVAEGDIFMMPGTTGAHIYLGKTSEEDIKNLKREGYMKNFNFARAGYTSPKFLYSFGPRSRKGDLAVYAPKRTLKRCLINAQAGRIPYTKIEKRFIYGDNNV